MFPLNPDIALLLFSFRNDDEHRTADHRRRMAEARRGRRARRSPSALSASRSDAGTQPLGAAGVRIVEAEASHRPALLAFLGELSPRTAYNRFLTHAAPADVVDTDLMLRNDACHRTVLAFRGVEIVGHAHAVASPDRNTAELGVVVADEWQGKGIGPRLVRALLETGPAATADELELLVLAWNGRARRMTSSLWPDAHAERKGELIHYRVHTARASGPATVVAAAAVTPCGT